MTTPLSTEPRQLPDWLLDRYPKRTPDNTNGIKPAAPISGVIPEGQRNVTLASLAGSMRSRGMEEPAIVAALLATTCDPPMPEDRVRAIAKSICRYPGAPITPRQQDHFTANNTPRLWPAALNDAAYHGLTGDLVNAIG